MNTVAASRRRFLQASVQAGGGLMLGFALPALERAAAAAPAGGPTAPTQINAWVAIGANDRITLVMHKSEMGQGVYTGLVQLLAEELECDLKQIRIETAAVAPIYNHPMLPMQFTGGSMSIASCWDQMRRVGAAARSMLVQAAAQRWKVDATDCHCKQGVVYGPRHRKASYGQLAAAAGKLVPPDPKSLVLKSPGEFKLIGKSIHRIESPEKVNGTAKFGLDVRVPGMLRAVIARPPHLGATARSIDSVAARAVHGVIDVVSFPAGIAVVAHNTYAARKGRDALVVDWQAGPGAAMDSQRLREDYVKLAAVPSPVIARKDGDAEHALLTAPVKLDATYEVPYLAHAMMEPLNCVAHWRADRCDVWTGTQMQSVDRAAAAEVAGLNPDQVFIHTMLLGGGFGRRANISSDFVREAVQLSKKIAKPVQIVWTREDDMRGGWYRPLWVDRIQAGLGADGKPVAWQHTVVGQSIMTGTALENFMVKDGIDATSVEGAADMPYAVPNVRVDLHTTVAPVKVQWWRSVGHSHSAFVVETFIDECAAVGGVDPLEYRRSLLGDKFPRHRAVLDLLAEKSGWGTPLPPGTARGIAVHESFGSVVGEVAEVRLQEGLPRVARVVAVIDCGIAVNPQLVKAQLESAITFGLSAALYGQISFKDGTAQQSNFDSYPVVRMNEMPVVEAYILPGEAAPSGVGEPGTPPIAPAVANALFALTKKRIRRLPMVQDGKFSA